MKNKIDLKNLVLISAITVSLSGCDSVKRTFGFDHYQADEMNVVDNPPLSLPPCYDLRPPEKNISSTSTTASNHTQKALEVLTGKKNTLEKKINSSLSSEKLVQKASQTHASDSKIKEKITEEAQQSKEESNPLNGVGKKIMENITNVSNDPKEMK